MHRRGVVGIVVCATIAVGTCGVALTKREAVQMGWKAMLGKARGGYSVAERMGEFGEAARHRLGPFFEAAQAAFPPSETRWVALKDERILEIYARRGAEPFHFIRSYPILAASGEPGPKLREGDRQVPEGIYRVVLLNPNSLYHVSLRLDYPNEFDQRMASADGRTDLGGDIMIHGKSASIGCLAMGDEAAEDLFALAHWVGCERVTVIISPTDFRRHPEFAPPCGAPVWADGLYVQIARRLGDLRRDAPYEAGVPLRSWSTGR
jgi:hypothetical protein